MWAVEDAKAREEEAAALGLDADSGWAAIDRVREQREREAARTAKRAEEQSARVRRQAAMQRAQRDMQERRAAKRESNEVVFGMQQSRRRRLVKAGAGGKRLKTTSSAAAGGSDWGGCWKPHVRMKAIIKGLDYIFKLAQKAENFDLFGNDMIQCFYDVAKGEAAPARRARAVRPHPIRTHA